VKDLTINTLTTDEADQAADLVADLLEAAGDTLAPLLSPMPLSLTAA
jgi:hypothetical protein